MNYDDIDYSDLEPVCALYDCAEQTKEEYEENCPLNSDTLGLCDRDFF